MSATRPLSFRNSPSKQTRHTTDRTDVTYGKQKFLITRPPPLRLTSLTAIAQNRDRGIRKIAAELDVGVGTVQRVAAELKAA
jgi:hypothetical protein